VILNPGIPIPEGAQAIHGISSERAEAEGLDPGNVIPVIAEIVEKAWAAGTVAIATNASFDVTLLDRELRRHAGRGLDLSNALVVDPLLIDRACDTYRPGGRKLVDLAAHYEVKVTDAHDALGDCMTAARVVWRQVRMTATSGPGRNGRTRRMDYSPLRTLPLPDLHRWQADRYSEWAAGFEQYLREKAEPRQPDAVIDRDWPWRPLPIQEGVPA
jgi:DNA polymerase-3 subunit epsilon